MDHSNAQKDFYMHERCIVVASLIIDGPVSPAKPQVQAFVDSLVSISKIQSATHNIMARWDGGFDCHSGSLLFLSEVGTT